MSGLVTTDTVAASAAHILLCANCVVTPTNLKGSNGFQRVQHGACVYCETKFVRTVHWLKRSASEWQRLVSP